jgi:hypothetical protein
LSGKAALLLQRKAVPCHAVHSCGGYEEIQVQCCIKYEATADNSTLYDAVHSCEGYEEIQVQHQQTTVLCTMRFTAVEGMNRFRYSNSKQQYSVPCSSQLLRV